MKFTEFNLDESLIAGLNDLQFNEPTPIQEQAIPIVTKGTDLIATAQTGTGKTGAFVIPIMQRVLESERKGIKALILSPTRELASQIDEQIFAIGYHAGITSATVIGGSDFSQQAKALKAGVDIIVATPGRLIDQNKVVGIDFSDLEYFVLDEADRMLDMGFLPDMKKIISWIPEKRQTLLFSATMPNEIKSLAGSIMNNPATIEIERSKPNQNVEQRAYRLKSNQKIPLVKKIFNDVEWESCIIFTSTKKGTDELQRLLKREGIKAASIHGDRTQNERNAALQAFKNGEVPVIVATDVLARGIDIKGVSIILNYDVPNNTDDYIHRIGRTGRYDKSGIAITFVSKRDSKTFSYIQKIKDNKLKTIKLPESFNDKSDYSWDSDFKNGDQKSQQKSKDTSSRSSKSSSSRSDSSSEKDQKDQKQQKSKPSSKKQNQTKSRSDKSDQKSQSRSQNGSTDKSNRSKKDVSKSNKPVSKKAEVKTPVKETPKPVEKEEVVIPPSIEQAVERNKYSRKPAKGVWGIIKSFIPKF
ncbi:MAG: DEAD/DEAH box helicase [Balneolaceae bacterium]